MGGRGPFSFAKGPVLARSSVAAPRDLRPDAGAATGAKIFVREEPFEGKTIAVWDM